MAQEGSRRGHANQAETEIMDGRDKPAATIMHTFNVIVG